MKLRRLLLTFLILHSVVACAGSRVYEWTEDVKLSDGTVITASRSAQYDASADLRGGREASWLQTQSTIVGPIGVSTGAPAFRSSLTPLAFDVSPQGYVFLVCIAASGLAIKEWKVRSKEPYVAFALRQGAWQRISMSEAPRAIRPNLLVSTRTLFFYKGGQNGMHVSLQLKGELDSNPQIDKRFKTIQR